MKNSLPSPLSETRFMANGTTDYSLGMLATKPNCSSYFCLTPYLSLLFYLLFKACERVLVERLTQGGRSER